MLFFLPTMVSSTSYSTASAPFSLPLSHSLHDLTNSFFNSSRLLNPTLGSSFCFPLRRSQKVFKIQNPPLIPKIQCIRETRDGLLTQKEFVAATPVTKDSWKSSILNSEIPVLVEFYASWCGPCRMVHRIIDEIATEYAGKLKCFVLNTDNDSQIAAEYEIKAVPVVLLFKNGEKCDTVIGTMPKEFYEAAIERVLKS